MPRTPFETALLTFARAGRVLAQAEAAAAEARRGFDVALESVLQFASSLPEGTDLDPESVLGEFARDDA